LFALHLTDITLELGGNNAQLTVDNGNLDVYSFRSEERRVGKVGQGDRLDLTAEIGPVSGSTNDVSFLYKPWTRANWLFAGGPTSVATQITKVSGGATTVTVTGLGVLSVATFDVKRQLNVNGGDLFALHLTDITLDLGGANAQLTVDNGNLDVYSF